MTQTETRTRTVKVFRYDPQRGGEGKFDSYQLAVPDETTTTILDVLLRIQKEQDATVAFRFCCRVNMCGSCGMVINGREGLACKTNVSHIPRGQDITIRPLNHFPVIKDLVVDMEPFFKKYEEAMPYFEPREQSSEPAVIRPDTKERQAIGMSTDCIACGCCVSSCTMCHYHEGYAGPAALNRAFTLLADKRDGLFDERLNAVLASCYKCRTEFNCTEVCPKSISGTRAIKYIQRLALKHVKERPKQLPAEAKTAPAPAVDRRSFMRQAGVGILGACIALGIGGVATSAFVGPSLEKREKQWVALGPLSAIPAGEITTVTVQYESKSGIYIQTMSEPIHVSRNDSGIICFRSSCTHLGCMVKWDRSADRFRCSCHGGAFDRNGNVIAGPPPAPLDRYAYKVDGDQLFVEVG